MGSKRIAAELQEWGCGREIRLETEWKGLDPLERMFRLGRRVLTEMEAGGVALGLGRLHGIEAAQWLEEIDALHPVEMRSPFEGCDDVAGGVWSGEGEDGILRLRFSPGASELPAHVHEFSDRVLVAVEGTGCFHASRQDLASFSGEVESWGVGPGSVIAFRRGLVHTFNAGPDGLTLLSFHDPFFPLDDARQYTLPDVRWSVKEETVG